MFTVDHYAISVKNIERSVEFYKKLDFRVEKEWGTSDEALSIIHMKNGEFILELFCYKQYTNMPHTAFVLDEDLPVIGSKHIGFYVDDLKKVQNYLKGTGLIKKEIEIKTGRLGRSYFFISDPDGILIEIIEKEGR
mgnify:FL=1